MNNKIVINWHWQPNEDEAITPIAVVAWHETVKHLLTHLSKNLDKFDLTKFQFVKGDHFIIIIGPSSQLPWVDGVQYAMVDNQTPLLWLPCHAKPSVPSLLLADAIANKFDHKHVLLWDRPQAIIPLSFSWPLTKEFIQYAL
ncbi:hypothetical protein ACFX2V_04280 [Gilliamella apicola]|uniref:bpX5 domain-containing protein n=1 Tax=Gilliamella apicola TaxID=1196095 RepID=UPI003987A137